MSAAGSSSTTGIQPIRFHGRTDPVRRRESRHDPEGNEHLKCIHIHFLKDQHIFRYIDLAHDPPEGVDDLHRHHYRLVERSSTPLGR